MSNIAIQVDNFSKQYRIGVPNSRYDTLRDDIMDVMTSLFRKNGGTP